MSILIKGMSMPKSCEECPFLEATSCEEDGRDFKCSMTGLYTTPRIKFIRCPLVEIPPHGRLIDADALKDIFFCTEVDGVKTHVATVLVNTIIDDAPTIIEAENSCGTTAHTTTHTTEADNSLETNLKRKENSLESEGEDEEEM